MALPARYRRVQIFDESLASASGIHSGICLSSSTSCHTPLATTHPIRRCYIVSCSWSERAFMCFSSLRTFFRVQGFCMGLFCSAQERYSKWNIKLSLHHVVKVLDLFDFLGFYYISFVLQYDVNWIIKLSSSLQVWSSEVLQLDYFLICCSTTTHLGNSSWLPPSVHYVVCIFFVRISDSSLRGAPSVWTCKKVGHILLATYFKQTRVMSYKSA